MKKQTAIKILAAMLTALMIITFMQSTVFASDGTTSKFLGDVETASQKTNNSATETKLSNMGGQIIRIMRIVGVVVAIAMLIYLAIKYIASAPDQKAEIKSSATKYVIGAVILFAASGILGIIEGFATGLAKTNN